MLMSSASSGLDTSANGTQHSQQATETSSNNVPMTVSGVVPAATPTMVVMPENLSPPAGAAAAAATSLPSFSVPAMALPNQEDSASLCSPCFPQFKAIKTRKPFSETSASQKRRRINNIKGPMRELMAGEDDRVGLLLALADSEAGGSVASSQERKEDAGEELAALVETYKKAKADDAGKKADNKAQQTLILSILRSLPKITRDQCNARFFSKPEDVEYRITKHEWQSAGLHLAVNGAGGRPLPEQFKETHTRVDPQRVMRLIQFLALDDNLQQFAYGVRHYITSDGLFKTIPSCTRKLPGKDLHAQFKKECEQRHERPPTMDEFTTALEVTGGGGNDKLFAALDNILVKDGIDNFKAMRAFAAFLLPVNNPKYAAIVEQIDSVEVYMRTEFPQHFSETSTTAFHSYEHVFGAAPNPVPPMKPSTACPKCDQLPLLIHNFRLLVNSLTEAELVSKAPECRRTLNEYITEKLENSLYEYAAHIYRSTVDKNRIDKILASLRGDEVLVIVDWKMKVQPTVYRESMVEYFGKRGFPLCGILFVRKRTRAELAAEKEDRESKNLTLNEDVYFLRQFHTRFFDGLCDDTKEDSWAAISQLQSAFMQYKASHGQHITQAQVMSDGAGCFDCINTLVFAPFIGRWTRISITNWFISEAGCGKTPLDGHFCYNRSRLIQGVMTGKGKFDVYDAESACLCLCQDGGIEYTTVAQVFIDRHGQIDANKFEGIRSFAHWQFVYDSNNIFTKCLLRPQSGRGAGVEKSADFFKSLLVNGSGIQQCVPVNGTGVTYRVYAPDTTIISRTSPPSIPLGIVDKSKAVRIRDIRVHKRHQKVVEELKIQEETRRQRQEDCNAFFCPETTCTAVFQRRANYDDHIMKTTADFSQHWLGKSGVMKHTFPKTPILTRGGPEVKKDLMITHAEACLRNVQGVKLPPQAMEHRAAEILALQAPLQIASYTCIDGSIHGAFNVVEAGFAMKGQHDVKAAKRRQAPKLEFIVWVHSRGVPAISGPNAIKMCPEQSARLMRLVGTQEGEDKFPNDPYMKASPTGKRKFLCVEWLHQSQIKSYMGKTNAALKKTHGNFIEKEATKQFPNDVLPY